MKYGVSKTALLSAVLLAGTAALQATPLVPGGTVSPGPLVIPSGSPITIDPVTLSPGALNDGFLWKKSTPIQVGSTEAAGNFITAVYKDTSTGALDFYYQIQTAFRSNATGQKTLLNSFQLTNWANVGILDVQAFTGGSGNLFGNGSSVEFKGSASDAITTVSRSTGTGNTINVNLAGNLLPGQNSAVLLIKTNAKRFDDLGSAALSWVTAPPSCLVAPSAGNPTPCGVADFPTFGLAALEPVVPEPGFYGVLSLSMIGLWMGVRRRSAGKAKANA
jgi:hypothetical protein